MPDPQDAATFERSKLTREGEPEGLRELHAELLRVRRELLPPAMSTTIDFDERAGWLAVRRGECTLLANFARTPVHVPRERTEEVLLATHEPTLEPGFVVLPAAVGSAGALMEVWPGAPFPLGATWDGEGTNFSIFSEHAERVELCLFDGDDRRDVRRADRAHVVQLALLPAGRARRASATATASTARTTRRPATASTRPSCCWTRTRSRSTGPILFDKGNVHPYVPTGGEDDDLTPDDSDDAAAIPKCVVIDPRFDWQDDRPPNTPLADSVIYETHVKGFTMPHPDVREDLRGTYAGLASDAAVGYLKELGVTAIELLPVHHIADEAFLADRGLTNYWGYSTIGFLAPHSPTPPPARPARRCASSRAWSRPCTRRGSR